MSTMNDPAGTMVTFVKLAAISQDRQQLPQRDKFLLLAGAAACEGGFSEVADRCRELVLQHNPRHLVGGYPSLADALCDADYVGFHTQLLRFCSYEQGEHLLAQQGLATGLPTPDSVSPRDYSLLLLGRM
jgi:hypothetical protein